MDQIMQVEATMSKGTTMGHRSLRLIFDTDENRSDEEMGKMMSWQDKRGWLTFSVPRIEASTLLKLPKLDPDEGKSPSQRLRACLFRLWEQRGKTDDFEMFYRIQMSRFIDVVKEKLT